MVLILVKNNNPALNFFITNPIYFSTNKFKWGLEIINEVLNYLAIEMVS